MKMLYAFGGHYAEKIVSEERLARKYFSNLQLN